MEEDNVEEEEEKERDEVFTVELDRGPHGLGLALVDGMVGEILVLLSLFLHLLLCSSPSPKSHLPFCFSTSLSYFSSLCMGKSMKCEKALTFCLCLVVQSDSLVEARGVWLLFGHVIYDILI